MLSELEGQAFEGGKFDGGITKTRERGFQGRDYQGLEGRVVWRVRARVGISVPLANP